MVWYPNFENAGFLYNCLSYRQCVRLDLELPTSEKQNGKLVQELKWSEYNEL